MTSTRCSTSCAGRNFLLAYQGEDDRALQARYGELVDRMLAAGRSASDRAVLRRARRARSRVGFASAFFRDGTAGRYFEHWITDLPRDAFEVFVYHLVPGARRARAAHRAIAPITSGTCPRWRPSQIAPRIRADALDVLVYPELGMARRDVRARGAAPRAAAMRGMGTSGDDGAADDRRVLLERGDGARRMARRTTASGS